MLPTSTTQKLYFMLLLISQRRRNRSYSQKNLYLKLPNKPPCPNKSIWGKKKKSRLFPLFTCHRTICHLLLLLLSVFISPGKYVMVMGVIQAVSPEPLVRAVKMADLSALAALHRRMWKLEVEELQQVLAAGWGVVRAERLREWQPEENSWDADVDVRKPFRLSSRSAPSSEVRFFSVPQIWFLWGVFFGFMGHCVQG